MAEGHELWHSYMTGWRDAAACRACRQAFAENPDASIRLEYSRGWVDGKIAVNRAGDFASELYGYRPTILRTQSEATGPSEVVS